MAKFFILDTNVLIHDPAAVVRFAEHGVIICLDVLEELDGLKQSSGSVGVAARRAIRVLEEFRQQGDLSKGVVCNTAGGALQVIPSSVVIRSGAGILPELDLGKVDNRLLAVQYQLSKLDPESSFVLVTKDINLRVKAGVLGIPAEDYKTDKVAADYTGCQHYSVAPEVIDALYEDKVLDIDTDATEQSFYPNELLCLVTEHTKQSALGIVRASVPPAAAGSKCIELIPDRSRVFGSKGARNREQQMALELLLRPEIPLVTINGCLGTGKTFITLLGALHAVLDLKLYDQILIARKYVHHGVKEGFLPGNLDEKSEPWMKPFFACLDILLGGTSSSEAARQSGKLGANGAIPMLPHEYLLQRRVVQCEHLAYIRGVTYNNKFIIIDEAANLTPDEAKTIIGRAGENTKIVLLGDLAQIDDPYLDAHSNGLAYTIETWKSDPLAGHITLTKGERSALAERASKLM